jgi:hypothetical protein
MKTLAGSTKISTGRGNHEARAGFDTDLRPKEVAHRHDFVIFVRVGFEPSCLGHLRNAGGSLCRPEYSRASRGLRAPAWVLCGCGAEHASPLAEMIARNSITDEDQQRIPNNVEANLGPLLLIQLSARF